MFPTLKVNLSGLDPNAKYFVLLDLVLADDSRFRFNAGWLRSGKAEPQWPSRIYTHPDSPATGAQWMKHEISFQKVKLTNNTMDQQGHVRTRIDGVFPAIASSIMCQFLYSWFSPRCTNTFHVSTSLPLPITPVFIGACRPPSTQWLSTSAVSSPSLPTR